MQIFPENVDAQNVTVCANAEPKKKPIFLQEIAKITNSSPGAYFWGNPAHLNVGKWSVIMVAKCANILITLLEDRIRSSCCASFLAQLSCSTAVLIRSVPCEQKLHMLCMRAL